MSTSQPRLGGPNEENLSQSRQVRGMAHSADVARVRNEGSPFSTLSMSPNMSLTISLESWVEISSQPSSSSLSSIGDEIVTTGLRVSGHQASQTPHSRRRRISHNGSVATSRTGLVGRQMSHSSQEEYSESSTSSEDESEQRAHLIK